MMRIFVYEYASATGAAHLLHAEGEAMLTAVADDFERVPGVRLMTWPEDGASNEEATFRQLTRAADFTLVIAPELDGTLLQRCMWVEEEGGRLLGPSPAAVALAGDKVRLAEDLAKLGVPTPPCRLFSNQLPIDELAYPLLWKPRFGAGSTATFLIRTSKDWSVARTVAEREAWRGESLVQPWIAGRPASVAFLIGPRETLALPPATQELSADDRFHYRGGRIPIAPELAERATRLARRAVAAVPGLAGYVGVDLVLGDEIEGSTDSVIEINPRLTTTYVGLRALCRDNPAEAMLRVVKGQSMPPLRWHSGSVRFSADGRVQVDRAD